MDLRNGKYLGFEIEAFSGDRINMWVIVFDGQYNHMLFNAPNKRILELYKRKGLPSNHLGKVDCVEYYSTFENALDNLMRVKVNGNKFHPKFLRGVFENE